MDKTLAKLIKRKREKIQMANIRNEREAFVTDPMDIKRIIK